MTTIKNIEKLTSWQKARELVDGIYEIIHRDKFSRDFGFKNQFQRAANPVTQNLVERFGSGSDPKIFAFLKNGLPFCGRGAITTLFSSGYQKKSVLYASDGGFMAYQWNDDLSKEIGLIISY